MSKVRADRYTNRADDGAPTFSQGVNVVGSGVSIGIGASVYSPANNQLVLGTNGGERVRINSNGDLGINTIGGIYTVQMHEPSSGSFTLQLTTGAIGTASTSGARITASSSRKLYFENQENEDTLFYNNGGEKLVIKAGGNVSITDGNLVVASGHGIDFSATANANGITSELLDDYEEGTYDVAMTMTSSGTVTLNTSYDTLSYTKIGRMVYITGQIRVASVSSPVGGTQINLPFTVRNNTADARGGGSIALYINGQTYYYYPLVYHIGESTSTINITLSSPNYFLPAGQSEYAISLSYITDS